MGNREALTSLLRARDFLLLFSILTLSLLQVSAGHGPEGGLIGRTIAIDPTDTNNIYVGTDRGGVYKSTNGGESWVFRGFGNWSVCCVVVDPFSTNVVYASVVGLGPEIGIYKSTDKGESWSRTLPFGIVWAVDPKNSEIVYAVSSYPLETRGVYKSTDRGENWERIGLENRFLGPLILDAINMGTIYVGVGDEGVFKSTNGGEDWDFIGLADVGVNSLALDPSNPNTVYAASSYPTQGVYKSTNGGKSWEHLASLCAWSIAIDHVNTRNIYIGCNGVHKSTDGGESWKLLNDSVDGPVILDPEDPTTIYAGTRGRGIAKSTDAGETWALSNRGLVATVTTGLAIAPSETDIVYVATEGGWSKTIARGESWLELRADTFRAGILAVNQGDSNTVYAGVANSNLGLLKSTDGGNSWGTVLQQPISSIAIDLDQPNTVYAGIIACCFQGEVWKSTDAGETWPIRRTLPTRDVFSLLVDPKNTNTVYAGTSSVGIYKSTDGGLSWNRTGLDRGAVWSMSTDAEGTIYAASGIILRSTDGGASWERSEQSIGAICVVVDPFDQQNVYAGGQNGVYKSTDGGRTWAPKNESLRNTRVRQLAIAHDTGRLYAATEGAGVWFSDDQAETWQ